MGTSRSTLEGLADQAREQRLEGDHHDSRSFPLTGYCFDNAFVMYHLLEEEGYRPKIVAGLSESYAEELVREVGADKLDTVEDLAGLVHYWVEVDEFVVDIAPEAEAHRGEPYVSRSLPETYHRLENSYEYAEETRQSALNRRCEYCGGKRSYCGCGQT